jgi:nicotinate-nucleotide pyrophosphorylase
MAILKQKQAEASTWKIFSSMPKRVVDYVSVGAVIHQAKSLDLSLKAVIN